MSHLRAEGRCMMVDDQGVARAKLPGRQAFHPFPRLIALGGNPASGKDLMARFLRDEFNYKVLGMSDTLAKHLQILDPYVPDTRDEETARKRIKRFIRYSELLEDVGYTKAKENPEVRRVLKTYATDLVRDQIQLNYWIEQMRGRIKEIVEVAGNRVVITGIRFPNEMRMVQSFRYKELKIDTVWLKRPGAHGSSHPSDKSLAPKDFDRVIENDGTVAQFEKKISDYMESFVPGGFENWESPVEYAH